MIRLGWNWARRNFSLVLLLTATICLVLALGEVIRGATWSLLIPVSLSAVVVGWELGNSKLSSKQAWMSLTAVGIPGVFIYVSGLILPIGRLVISIVSLIPQAVLWLYDRIQIDIHPLVIAWNDLANHIVGVLTRFWGWCVALFAGIHLVDPLIVGLVWCLILWLIGTWAGWQLRRNRQALTALAPGSIVLALTLDYTRGDVGLVVVYLAILLTLMGLTKNEWRHIQWQQRKVDYAESIAIDTLAMVGFQTVFLVILAAGAPSISWRELVEKFQRSDRPGEDRIAESLGLEAPVNVATSAEYRADGLPRSHLLNMPPELQQEVVMTISTGELPPIPETITEIHPNRYYWRAITYDMYSGSGWSSSTALETSLPSNTTLLDAPEGYRLVTQQVNRFSEKSTAVYWTGILAQADVDIDIAWRAKPPADASPTNNGDMLGALTEDNEYTVISYVPQFSTSELRAAGSDYPTEITQRYLQLPDSTPERVLVLARKLTQVALTPYDRAAAIEAYLRNFPYSLEVEPPPPNRDVVDYFLFTAQQGYCDYYATAMVVLARAVGLPARIVVGYASGDYHSSTAEYIIRQEDAHSWAEIYFSGIGWVEFEPTASQPAIERSGEESAPELSPNLPGGQSAISWLKAKWRSLISDLGGRVLLAGIGLALLFALWQIGEIWYLHLLPSHKTVQNIYSRLEKITNHLLPSLPNGHTPYQLQTALTDVFKNSKKQIHKLILSAAGTDVEEVVSLYSAQVFSNHPPTKIQVSRGIRAWLRLRWKLWVMTTRHSVIKT